jgi:hypothetical protein
MIIGQKVTETQKGSDGKILYAVCVEVYDKAGEVKKTVVEYIHATDYVNANWSYRTAHSSALIKGKIRIVDIAPAIGWFVEDSHGEVLSG